MKILVADDHPTNRNLLRMMLLGLGHVVSLAEDGQETCERLAAEDYDLVLLDLNMPKLTGLEVLQWLHAQPEPPPRVVVVTADASEQSRLACLAAGANDVQTKPIDVSKLVMILTTQASAAAPQRRKHQL